MNPIEHAVARPFPEVLIDRRLRRKILWQLSPLATRAIYIADRVEHLRVSVSRLRPPVRASGIIGSIIAHSSSLTSRPLPRFVFLALFVAPHGSPLSSNRLP